ncbi:hypothetical protein JB92DRAFT_2982791 [Gautieria morchelliformis]|nr:hypothetical protein JB92DRAFT_2982791 [Gautieria morchelliformis]
MVLYHPTGIRALALSPVPSNPMTVCTGLESGNIQRFEWIERGSSWEMSVWDLFLPPGASIPANMSDRDAMLLNKQMGPSCFRTLHTPFPVLVVSSNESERDTVEIWDIRGAWIDIAFAGSHKLWAQHVSGTFAQHDLRESLRPLDAIPTVAMSWTEYGSLTFVTNIQPVVELPYDDA